MSKIATSFVLVFAVVFAASCSDSDDDLMGGSAELQLRLTDAPSDVIKSAQVTVSRVYLNGDVEVELAGSGGTVTYDLMQLRNGIEALLAAGTIPAGDYSQLRLVVDSAIVTLADGVTFEDGSATATLFVPSGMESGIKVLLDAPIEAEDGSLTITVVDFDVDENFVIHGDPTVPDGVTRVQFTPLLNEKSRSQHTAN